MTTVNFFTYRDAIRHCADYLGVPPEAQAKRDCRRAVLESYREFSAASRWFYYFQRGRINTSAPQTTGTVTYVSATRQLTLTGATWPSWVTFGVVVIQNITYDVDTSVSSTVVTLSTNACPNADISTATQYTLYRDTYPLPADCLQVDQLVDVGNQTIPCYVNPRDWLQQQRITKSPARPRDYTITSDPHYFGTMAIRFFPPPDTVYEFDFMYQRQPRQLRWDDVNAGTVSIAASSAVVTGTGTAFDSRYAGSVIRTSTTSTDSPEALTWETPYDQERVILTYTSTTSVTVDTTYPTTYSGVKYIISDPIDIEAGAMLNCFLRCCEKNLSYSRKDKNIISLAEQNWRFALMAAREADARHFQPQVAGEYGVHATRLSLMPRGPDMS
jgi:hypothetical protein